MKSIALYICILVFTSFAFAGGIKKSSITSDPKPNLRLSILPDDKSKYLNLERRGRALAFGYFEFNPNTLNTYLDTTTSKSGAFTDYYMGISLDNIKNNSKHLDAISSFSFIIPQKVNGGANDSLELRMGGWHWTTSFFGLDFIKGEIVTLAIGPSISWGNLKMRRTVLGQRTKYTNPFVAPGGRAEFRLTFGNFMIGGRATYRYDITHGLWKRKDNLMPALPEYKNHGLAYFGYIGWIF